MNVLPRFTGLCKNQIHSNTMSEMIRISVVSSRGKRESVSVVDQPCQIGDFAFSNYII